MSDYEKKILALSFIGITISIARVPCLTDEIKYSYFLNTAPIHLKEYCFEYFIKFQNHFNGGSLNDFDMYSIACKSVEHVIKTTEKILAIDLLDVYNEKIKLLLNNGENLND